MTIRGSVRILAGQILGAVRTRVELFGVEWQQARSQVAGLVGLLLAGVAFLWLAAMMFSFLVVTLAWPTPYRNWVVVGLLLLYLIAGLVCLMLLKRRLEQTDNHPFSGTVHELTRDAGVLMDALEGGKHHSDDANRQHTSSGGRSDTESRR